MTTPVSILLYGKDISLLQTRQWILEARGYRVWPTSDLADVKRVASEEPIDVLLLCHSLSPEECGQAIASTLVRRPATRTLIMAATSSTPRAGETYQVVDTAFGPAKLIDSVAELVEGANNPSSPNSRP